MPEQAPGTRTHRSPGAGALDRVVSAAEHCFHLGLLVPWAAVGDIAEHQPGLRTAADCVARVLDCRLQEARGLRQPWHEGLLVEGARACELPVGRGRLGRALPVGAAKLLAAPRGAGLGFISRKSCSRKG